MPFTEKPPRIPEDEIPIIEPNGRLNATWRRWLVNLLAWLARLAASIP